MKIGGCIGRYVEKVEWFLVLTAQGVWLDNFKQAMVKNIVQGVYVHNVPSVTDDDNDN